MSSFEQTTDEPTNEERAGRIDTVMQAYCLTLEGRDFDGDEDDVKDLLADLMHFCKRMEIDFEENLRVARNNYKHEWDAENGTPNTLVCPVCGCFLEVSRTDTLLGIDREIFDCQSCDETFIRELTVADGRQVYRLRGHDSAFLLAHLLPERRLRPLHRRMLLG